MKDDVGNEYESKVRAAAQDDSRFAPPEVFDWLYYAFIRGAKWQAAQMAGALDVLSEGGDWAEQVIG